MIIGVSACTEQECCVLPEEPTIVGTWTLTKLCFSNGASSCNEEDMWDADFSETLTFTEDGNLTINRDGDLCSATYAVRENRFVDLVATSGNCNFDNTTFFLGKVTSEELLFSPQCIEGCPHLYIRQ